MGAHWVFVESNIYIYGMDKPVDMYKCCSCNEGAGVLPGTGPPPWQCESCSTNSIFQEKEHRQSDVLVARTKRSVLLL